MKYFEVKEDFSRFADRWHLNDPFDENEKEIDSRLFRYGKAYHGLPPKTISVDVPGTEVAFTFGPFSLPVIREDFRIAIESIAKDGYELYPVEVIGSNSRFWIINVTTQIDCVDESSSKFTKFGPGTSRPDLPNNYSCFFKLIIDKKGIESHIFRIKNFVQGLIVSEEIRNKLINIPDLGVGFREV